MVSFLGQPVHSSYVQDISIVGIVFDVRKNAPGPAPLPRRTDVPQTVAPDNVIRPLTNGARRHASTTFDQTQPYAGLFIKLSNVL